MNCQTEVLSACEGIALAQKDDKHSIYILWEGNSATLRRGEEYRLRELIDTVVFGQTSIAEVLYFDLKSQQDYLAKKRAVVLSEVFQSGANRDGYRGSGGPKVRLIHLLTKSIEAKVMNPWCRQRLVFVPKGASSVQCP